MRYIRTVCVCMFVDKPLKQMFHSVTPQVKRNESLESPMLA